MKNKLNLKEVKKAIAGIIKQQQLNEAENCWGTVNGLFGFDLPGGNKCLACTGCGVCPSHFHTSKAACEEAQGPVDDFVTLNPTGGTGKPGMDRGMMKTIKEQTDSINAVPWSQLGGEDDEIRGTFTQMGKDISKDAEKLADHPLFDRINTKDKWVDVMYSLMIHSNSISSMTDSIRKSTLQDIIQTIGKE